MKNRFEHLNAFFERFIRLGWWDRLFRWREIRTLSYEAYEELKAAAAELETVHTEAEKTARNLETVSAECAMLNVTHDRLEKELRSTITERTHELSRQAEKLDGVERARAAAEKDLAGLRALEENRKAEHAKAVATLAAIQQRIVDERRAEQEERERARMERMRAMKEQWARHQDDVRALLKRICAKHAVEYVASVPFKGNPDNTLKIADEFIVFDAKSPGGDDLRNFPTYLKTQAEAVRKYAREAGVRKEIFLVIPSATVDVVEQYCYNLADYTVYVISPNALEPIILSLRRLEDYEFVEQLSPEERENICRLIGKFAHIAKMRIQVDHYFALQFLDVLTRCEANLPREMLERVVEFELSEKLNPPQERRAKEIPTRELEEDTKRIQHEAKARAIPLPPSLEDQLNGLPLFEQEG
jgi:hypothetical protein